MVYTFKAMAGAASTSPLPMPSRTVKPTGKAPRRDGELTTVARVALRSGSSGCSQARQREPAGRVPAGASVSHQNANTTSVIPAAITVGSHQAVAVAAAVIVRDPDGTSTSCQRSSQPRACVNA
jgi:hypothetical protein